MFDLDRRIVLLSAVAALSAAVLSVVPVDPVTATPKEHVIEIQKFRFVPSMLRVRPNDTITWINRDITPHTATATDKSWDTGEIKRNGSARVTSAPDMSTAYVCRYHPGMKAVLEIIVEN